ncbi:helix-turn-helix transcriptional regulator [Salinivibrio sp. VYel1]|uniref:helix-turn-helix transcriptional regulator n=1 Tax=Salinivibrio sp. VYel1 TaxID=2490490 RepID=UPI00128B1236|nr:helix-turn-helix transcriptional regulator [Salinivibrio sp. VYel1]MPX91386.1 XRE family transcriptional regulator [Salinivibrio sp. VYel1]
MTTPFSARLHQARIDAGITQVSVAKQLDCARQTYLDLETGKTEPRLSSIEALSKIIGVDKNWLAFGESSGEAYQPAIINIDGTKYVRREQAA